MCKRYIGRKGKILPRCTIAYTCFFHPVKRRFSLFVVVREVSARKHVTCIASCQLGQLWIGHKRSLSGFFPFCVYQKQHCALCCCIFANCCLGETQVNC